MSQINVTNVKVLDNPAPFSAPFRFEITFEAYPPALLEELEWKLIYVGSADDVSCDQELDSVLVGPVSVGKNVFVFEAPAPDPRLIPEKDVMEVTVLILSALYREAEFIRVGYYVNVEYDQQQPQLRAEWDAYKQAMEQRAQQEQAELQRQQELQAWQAAHPPASSSTTTTSEPPPPPSTPPPSSTPIPIAPMPALPSIQASSLTRNILSEQPRVTRFQIAWDATKKADFEMEQEDERWAKEQEGKGEEERKEGGEAAEGVKRRKLEGPGEGAGGGGKEEKAEQKYGDEDGEDEDEEEDDDDEEEDADDGSGDEADALQGRVAKDAAASRGAAAAAAPSSSSSAPRAL